MTGKKKVGRKPKTVKAKKKGKGATRVPATCR